MTKKRMRSQEHVGDLNIPAALRDYVEQNGDRLIVEQTAFDACNGYALGIGSRVQIKRFVEFCPICGYNSQSNPNQKRILGENRHRLNREWVTIFDWDDYSFNQSLEESSLEFLNDKGVKEWENFAETNQKQKQNGNRQDLTEA